MISFSLSLSLSRFLYMYSYRYSRDDGFSAKIGNMVFQLFSSKRCSWIENCYQCYEYPKWWLFVCSCGFGAARNQVNIGWVSFFLTCFPKELGFFRDGCSFFFNFIAPNCYECRLHMILGWGIWSNGWIPCCWDFQSLHHPRRPSVMNDYPSSWKY